MREKKSLESEKFFPLALTGLHFGLLLGLLTVCYVAGFKTPFLLDDQHVILERAELRGAEPLTNFLRTDPSRSLVYLSFTLDHKLFHFNAWGYHFQNLLGHLLVSFLFYLLLRQILFSISNSVSTISWSAFFLALIFGIHPVNTEAVTYLSGRFSVFAGMFILGSLFFFVWALDSRGLRGLKLFFSYFAFFLSILSKEEGFVVPILIMALLWSRKETRKRDWIFLIPFLLIALLGLFLRYFSLGRLGSPTLPHPRLVYLATEIIVIAKYLFHFFLPVHLKYLPELAPVKRISFELVICFFLLVGIWVPALKTGFKSLYSFGIIWLFFGLAPSSSIIPLEDFMALHRFYNAMPGALIALGTLFVGRINFSSKRKKALSIFLLGFIIGVFCFLTVRRNLVFADQITLLKDALRHSPKSGRLLNDLGYTYYRRGDYERARYYLSRALARDPDNFMPWNNMGLTEIALGNDDSALNYFFQAVSRTAKPGKIYANIGMIYLKKGEPGSALSWLKEARRREPHLGEVRFYLGLALVELGEEKDGLQEMILGIQNSPPSAKMYFELGKVFLKVGELESARQSFIYALQIDPYFMPAQIALQQIPPASERKP